MGEDFKQKVGKGHPLISCPAWSERDMGAVGDLALPCMGGNAKVLWLAQLEASFWRQGHDTLGMSPWDALQHCMGPGLLLLSLPESNSGRLGATQGGMSLGNCSTQGCRQP